MSENGASKTAAAALQAGAVAGHGAVLAAFTGAMFLSALLLFMVQPMFAKMVLPLLGGSPAVWSVAMCFFQVTLLAGYAYAHALSRVRRPGIAAGVHVAALSLAALTLPLGVAAGWERPPEDGAALWVFGLFAVSIGLPFLTLAANAPALQAWFSKTGHPHAADPYFLYGASNLGSLLALLAYPALMEPNLSLTDQSLAWTVGFVALIAAVGGCAVLAAARERTAPAFAPTAGQGAAAAPPSPAWSERLRWIGLAFIPSALLVAVTNHISTDVSSAPFLWVIPLALFLLTFVITFQQRPILSHSAMLALQPAAAAAMIVVLVLEPGPHWVISLLVHLGGFFVLAMVCHGALVARRPAASHLTEFYLFMSLGGALGGVFTSLLAPQLFSSVIEFPLLIVAALLARPGLLSPRFDQAVVWAAAAPALVAAAFALEIASSAGEVAWALWLPFLAIAALAGAAMLRSVSQLGRGLAVGAATALALSVVSVARTPAESHRGFFGVTKVTETPDGRHRLMLHGTTLHGAQRLEDGALVPEPLTYYHAGSPLAEAIGAARANGPLERIGVVGLGTGSLACHRREGETWSFFEIDPIVVRLALDPAYFTFLSECAPDARMVVGDARVTLGDEPDGGFDLLVLDAFSSDAIPTHLLTLEALDRYMAKLAPGGLLAMHISNRNVDLGPVVAALAQRRGLAVLHRWAPMRDDMKTALKSSVRGVVLARSADDLAPLDGRPGWAALPPSDWPVWRDDYANVLQAILAGFAMEAPQAEAAD